MSLITKSQAYVVVPVESVYVTSSGPGGSPIVGILRFYQDASKVKVASTRSSPLEAEWR